MRGRAAIGDCAPRKRAGRWPAVRSPIQSLSRSIAGNPESDLFVSERRPTSWQIQLLSSTHHQLKERLRPYTKPDRAFSNRGTGSRSAWGTGWKARSSRSAAKCSSTSCGSRGLTWSAFEGPERAGRSDQPHAQFAGRLDLSPKLPASPRPRPGACQASPSGWIRWAATRRSNRIWLGRLQAAYAAR